MDYFLGVDIGTTSVKAIAFNRTGELICRHSSGYEMQHPRANYSEHDADQLLDAVVYCINRVIEEMLPAQPVFVSFSAMMHSLIALDEQGEPITNCIIWADNRAAGIAKHLRDSPAGESIYHATGVPIHAMSPFCKLLWFKENDRGTYNRAAMFVGIKEYIFSKLFGEYIVDTGIASATGLLNLDSLRWDTTILDLLELSEKKLPRIVPVDHAVFYRNKIADRHALHIKDDTPFIIGSSDGALANLGTCSSANDSMSVTIGTSAAVRTLSEEPVTEKNMSTFCYHAKGRQYIIGGASNNGAVVMQWLKDSLLETSESYEELFRMAEKVSLQNDDLFFLPYIFGERAPVWNSDAKGVFFGLTINHKKAHLVRAVMEGITYNLFSIGKLLMNRTEVKQIYATGGFAGSTLWLQLLADVFNRKVLLSGSPESSALGAVIIGVQALNLDADIQPKIISEYAPDFYRYEIYNKQYQKFERLYKLLKSEFVEAEALSIPITH